jgi:16S rRNA U516 pseudouridylate synthase RsuA-like enzyme
MNIELGTLPVGKWRHLTDDEVENLFRIISSEEPVQKY